MYADICIRLPEEILLTLRKNKDDLVKDMKLALAVKYFTEKKLSIGQCAELAEMTYF